MPRAIISLVGTSLLTRHIEALRDEGKLASQFSEFLRGHDSNEHRKIAEIVEIIDPEKGNELVSYLKEAINNPAASAERNSLSNMHLQKKDILYFLASNTLPGKICAQALYQYYKEQNNYYDVREPIIILKLKDKDTFNDGLRELTDKIVKIISDEKKNGNEVIINATGGYKPESTFATLSGILEGAEVNYLHEEFSEPVKLPSIPISFNLSLFHSYAVWIKYAIKGSQKAYDKLPQQLQALISFNQEQDSLFTPLGKVLWNAYLNAISPRGRKLPEMGLIGRLDKEYRDKVLKFVEKWDSLWTGDQVPQMVDHEQSHCQDVLLLAEQALLPILEEEANFLTRKELYYLISAIFLHDVGHATTTDENGEILLPEEIRKNHAELGYKMIEKDPGEFGFARFNDEAKRIATIGKYHDETKWKLTELPGLDDGIRVQFITALLRVFDAADCQISRVGEEDYREKRLKANQREKELYQALQKKNPQGRIKEYIDSKINFLEVQNWHFDLHSQISLVHMEPEKADNRWNIKIVYHPVKPDAVKGKGFEDFISKELDAPGVQEVLDRNSISFQVERGEPLA